MYDEKFQPHPDPEIREFEESLLRSIDDARRGTFAAVHTPEQIMARRRGRPVGSVQTVTKKPVTLRLDPDVLERWRSSGKGWQTRAAQTLSANAPR